MKTFKEVTAFDGVNEWMFHLEEGNKPVRLYGYRDNEFDDDVNPKSKSVFVRSNFRDGSNHLFVHLKGDENNPLLQKAWNKMKKWVDKNDLIS